LYSLAMITSSKEATFTSASVCLLAGLRKNYSTVFTKFDSEERWHTGTRKKRTDFGGNPDYVTLRLRLGDGRDIPRKVKVHTLDIAPLRSESPPQKRSSMARVLKGFHSFTCTPTRSPAIKMPAFAFSAIAGTHLPTPEGWKAE